jgi:hypothetical protein
MSLAVDPLSSAPTEDIDHWVDHHPKNVEFPSISTAASSYVSDADTFQNPEVRPRGPLPGIGPPGSLSNLRVRFRSLGFGEEKQVTDAPTFDLSSSSELELEAKPTVFYASSFPLRSGSFPSDGAQLNVGSSAPTGMDPPPATTKSDDTDQPPSPSSSTTSDTAPEAATAPGPQLDLEATTTRLGTPTAPCYTGGETHIAPDGICIYCPSSRFAPPSTEGAHYPPQPLPMPPTTAGTHSPVVPSSYAHYGMPQDPGISAAPQDSGMVYYPSLSVTPAPTPPTTTGYEYLDAHYGTGIPVMHNMPSPGPVPTPGWGGYDPSSMMMPLPMGIGMGVNMNMGMGMVPLPMGVNMNMNMNMSGVGMNMGMGMPPPPPPLHGYYEGVGGQGSVGRREGLRCAVWTSSSSASTISGPVSISASVWGGERCGWRLWSYATAAAAVSESEIC